ncbi:MAG: hypothetical protein IPK26_07745 [Planctomycetes bacterium]|nr:hypothetical protein [Planctomycetota bacterium]
MSNDLSAEILFLRHTVAVLAYRAEKALRDWPADSAHFQVGAAARTPLQLGRHLGDLAEWAFALAFGDGQWRAAGGDDFGVEVNRFFTALERLDRQLADATSMARPAGVVFQGPIADALTHVGQLAMLRGLCGSKVRPESYARAEIVIGRVGREQAPTRREFDGDASARR